VTKRHARIYDALALLVVIIIIGVDQWTKALVVEHLSPPDTGPRIHLIGQYLILFYIQNYGVAFSLFANSVVLIGLIIIAIGVISYMYARMINSGSLAIKLIFGMIVGGALGNIIDRARHAGYVVDFIAFRIPQINFYFAIFNIADAAISVGVFLLFVALLISSFRRPRAASDVKSSAQKHDDSLGNQQKGTP
jgi:signal peptidase II